MEIACLISSVEKNLLIYAIAHRKIIIDVDPINVFSLQAKDVERSKMLSCAFILEITVAGDEDLIHQLRLNDLDQSDTEKDSSTAPSSSMTLSRASLKSTLMRN